MATTPNSKSTGNRQARRTTTSKPKPKVSDQPQNPTLVLSNLERESRQEEPFIVHLPDGEQVEIGDPGELDYAVAATAESPADALAAAMSEEDYGKLIDSGVKLWQFAEILKMWRDHYGMGTQGE